MTWLYVFISERFTSSVIYTVLTSDGQILTKQERYTYLTAKQDSESNRMHQLYQRCFPEGYEVVWLDAPWKNEGFKTAVQRYQRRTGLKFQGPSVDTREDAPTPF